MKKNIWLQIIVLIPICFVFCGVSQNSSKTVNFVEETRSFLGIILGITHNEEIIKRFGEPSKVFNHETHGGNEYLCYETKSKGKRIYIKFCSNGEFDDNAPSSISVDDATEYKETEKTIKYNILKADISSFATNSGLEIGKDEKWVLKNFGNPIEIEEERWYYTFTAEVDGCELDYGIIIDFKDRKCISFSIYRSCGIG